MASLADLTHESFAPHQGSSFEMQAGEARIPLRLAQVTTHAPNPRLRRTPFSLLFVAPPGTRQPQKIYTLVHPELGELAIFLVPIGADAEGTRYEAVFT